MWSGRVESWNATQRTALVVAAIVLVWECVCTQNGHAQAPGELFTPPAPPVFLEEFSFNPTPQPATIDQTPQPLPHVDGEIPSPPQSTLFGAPALPEPVTLLTESAPPPEDEPQPAPETLPTTDSLPAAPPLGIDIFDAPLALSGTWEYQLSSLDAVRIGLEKNKEILVLSIDPTIDGTLITTAKSVFDPVSGVAAYGGQSDVQVRSLIQSFGSFSDFLDTNFLRPFNRPNNLYLRRNLVSGGQAELGFSSDYEDYFPQGNQLIVNPGWDSALNFRFDQPLMRGRGTASSLAPLKIAQAKFKESRFTFISQIRVLSRDIELTYWEFAGAERSHKVVKQLVADIDQLLDEESRRVDLGQSALPNLLQVRSLYEEFRVLELERAQQRDIAESRLRQIMGIDLCAIAEGKLNEDPQNLSCLPLAANDEGATASAAQPFEETLPFALQRPEILAQRAVVDAVQVDLARARNDLRPDLSARVNYSVNGLDENLGQSIRTIARHEYKTWGVGLIYERPFGLRSAKADATRTELLASQEFARLNKIEYDISHALRRAEEKLHTAESILVGQEKRVGVAQDQLDAYTRLYEEGRVDIFLRVESERTLAAAKLEMVDAWRDRQLAITDRNFEANLASPAYQFANSPE